MKAAQLTKFGESDAIAINSITIPEVSEGKVLVEVHAAGVNPVDWKIRSGMMEIPLPATLGGDFSGVIKETGPGVSVFRAGDEVYGQAAVYRGGSGAFEEFALADTDTIALKPGRLDHLKAAALPLAGVSALQALTDHMKLSRRQKVLIHGGGGGIGSIAIQIAKHLGARVAVTAAAYDARYVKSLGAGTVIDFRKKKFEESLRNYDAVLDLVGGDVYRRSFRVLRPGGIIVSLLEKPDEDLIRQYEVNAVYQHTQVSTERLNRLTALVDRGYIKVHLDRIFPLEKTGEAVGYLEKSHPKGKVVIDMSATVH